MATKIGTSGNDLIQGTSSADYLFGNPGNDTLFGYDGNDSLDGGTGADSLVGGLGNDSYTVDDIGDVVVENANEGVDEVFSTISYTLGNNLENLTLQGSGVISGTGNALDNRISGNALQNVLSGLDGNDTLEGSSGNDTLLGGTGNDCLVGDAGNDSLDGGTGNDVLVGGLGNDLLDGGTGADTMQGGTGNDTYVVDSYADIVSENPGAGTDTVRTNLANLLKDNFANIERFEFTGNGGFKVVGTAGDDSLVGDSGKDIITGLAGNDTLVGWDGDDTLDGGAGVDSMDGGAGNDLYFVDNNNDVVVEVAGGGNDTVSSSASSYALADGVDVEELSLAGTGNISGTGNSGDNFLVGNAGANTLDGREGNDTLSGGAGNDILRGGLGNDCLDGGAGVNTLVGGAGDDTYLVGSNSDVFQELPGGGTDTVRSTVSFSLASAANVENLVLVEGSSATTGSGNGAANSISGNSSNNTLSGGDGNDSLLGYAGDDSLDGGAGNDVLNGGTGADTMAGGDGDDTYVVDSSGDRVVETATGGTDTAVSSVILDKANFANVENFVFSGNGGFRFIGTAGADSFVGANGKDSISGLAGNDTLDGAAGDDTIDGGTGIDSMIGGAGNDLFIVDNSADAVVELASGGNDTVQASASYTLSPNIESLVLTGAAAINGTGNASANTITGNAAANLLDGGAGQDTLIGGAGNDTYVVDDVLDQVTEAAGQGWDVVLSSASSFSLPSNVEELRLTGSANTVAVGNSLNNKLVGNSGSNRLDGQGGADTMAGGLGGDAYFVDNIGDVIIENPGEGTDTAFVLKTLGALTFANVENIVYVDSFPIIGTEAADSILGTAGNDTISALGGNDTVDGLGGNDTISGDAGDDSLLGGAGNDTLLGGTGNDFLDGGTGNDSLAGGTGDDTYAVDSAGDVVVEAANEGTDEVRSSATTTLGANVENLALTGALAINGTGNNLANTIVGNARANRLSGLAGDDCLSGGGGVDTLVGGAGNDTYVIDVTAPPVTIVESAAATDGTADVLLVNGSFSIEDPLPPPVGNPPPNMYAGVEILRYSGPADVTLTGNSRNNRIESGSGNDSLVSGTGVDTLVGGAGNDTYLIGGPGDTIIENPGEGTDLAMIDGNFTLPGGSSVENLTLIGTGNYNAVGSDIANLMTGNAGDNALTGMGGNDTLLGLDGNDIVNGGTGADCLVGGTGNDTYVVSVVTDPVTGKISLEDTLVENAGEGTDEIRVAASADLSRLVNFENVLLLGTGDFNATGNTASNKLTGNSGKNRLDGGAGTGPDTLLGGTGDDTYLVHNPGDVVTENRGEGYDTVISSATTYTLSDYVEELYVNGGAGSTGIGNNTINRIFGNDFDNVLSGLGGADTLQGNGGNDYLDGGFDPRSTTQSADILIGGTGDDTYVVDNGGTTSGSARDHVEEAADPAVGGIDKINLYPTIVAYTRATGKSAIVYSTNPASISWGVPSKDEGGAYVQLFFDKFKLGDLNYDPYRSVVDRPDFPDLSGGRYYQDDNYFYALEDNVENLNVEGRALITNGAQFIIAPRHVYGNALDNYITANDDLSTTSSTLELAYDNYIDGQGGNDTMAGGIGDDTYIVDSPGDVALEVPGEGDFDEVRAAFTYDLANSDYVLDIPGQPAQHFATIECLRLVESTETIVNGRPVKHDITGAALNFGGYGNAADNSIVGNSGDNTLDGRDGNDTIDGGAGNDCLIGGLGADCLIGGTNSLTAGDTMAGGLGNDTYIVDSDLDVINERDNEGTDLAIAQFSIVLPADSFIENIQLYTNYPGEVNNFNAIGSNSANNILGNAGVNRIEGRGGDDTLIGRGGSDTILGGDGNDILAAGYLSLDTVTGNSHETSDASPDYLAGGAGNDTYTSFDPLDTVVEFANEGTDLVRLGSNFTTYTLGANIENATYTFGNGPLLPGMSLTGNELDNSLAVDPLNDPGSNDILNGLGGNDTLSGGNGDDTYYVDSIGDKVEEIDGGGVDIVYSSVSYDLNTARPNGLVSFVDNLDFTSAGTSAIVGKGNFLNNVITGSAGNNILDGNGGNDTIFGGLGRDSLNGGSGNDSLDGGIGADTLVGGTGDDTYVVDDVNDLITGETGGTDLVQTSASIAALASGIDNVVIANGTGNINVTGNTLANRIDGNDGDNILLGGSGDDSLFGAAGNDCLNGGPGTDLLEGGTGNDTYVYDGNDTLREFGLGGIDEVQSSVTFTLGNNFENLTLTGAATQGTGNDSDNLLLGNNQANSLSGERGNDTLSGGAGNDTLTGAYVGTAGWLETDTLTGGAGSDIFVLGDSTNAYYNSAAAGGDYALITDFSLAASDGLQLKTLTAAAGNVNGYVIGGDINALGLGASANSYLYRDADNSGTASAGDSLIAAINATGGTGAGGALTTLDLNKAGIFV